ncbi:eukaryotic translation initiation factor 3 subunit B [Candida albicans P60002]|nr:eukaryotic translation initiation factor 3 subunit B [Candida albicans P37005]KGQ85648.1 eukaryotic translation initiation factor 3 subunit B [Candida albicans GC75]KGU02984.1 eukaryotic translation initiation factor 3 subunit B [Candida albicans P87]KGU24348.1 eukaryotic translation initiation factor 3 subunit B [Candida albicans P75063]KHC31609.1 eukaryotic translation initiation factor 3 subunit B [Candida albicans Ca6]KHC45990.1 eukaryotic translation initiation factor 3 subunit B [Cand
MSINEEDYLQLEKEIKLDDIDFSDLEEKYEVNIGLDNYIIVDGAPIAPEAKVPVLIKVLRKLFSQVGEIVEGDEGIYMPLENGKSKGYLFIQFKSTESADLAIKKLHGKKLDQNHRLLVNKLSDMEKYGVDGAVNEEFIEPEIEPFQSHGYLKSWLQDEQGRDQMVLHFSETVGVYWNKKSADPEPVIEPRKGFTSKYAKFSPKGTYLFSIHPQGIQSWGGANFNSIKRFFHQQVRLVDFSPNEKFMVTLSPIPISLPDSTVDRAQFPFGPESEGHKLVIWNMITGEPVRTFALPPHLEGQKEMPWPLVKWSYDDKYCARQGPDALAIYETESNFQLLDKKLVKVDGIQDFEWAPAGVKLHNSKAVDGEHVLSYWTPESTNQTARVALMQIPSREILRTVNLFQVSDCKMHWQSNGKLLCVKVDRHTKSGKTIFSNLEFFKTNERDIPVEKLELKDVVVNFAWEPNTERFITISRLDDGNPNPAIPKNTISFYAPEVTKGGVNHSSKKKGGAAIAAAVAAAAINNQSSTKYKAYTKIENKHSNTIFWSPKGRYVVVATISRTSGELEFFDVSFDDETNKKSLPANVKLLKTDKFSGMTNISWDPSGRFVAAWSTSWLHAIENGYRLYEFTGNLLRDDSIDQFKDFVWRPRPPSLLTNSDKKKVRSNLREYSAQFEEADAMEADAAVKEIILARRKALEEWRKYRAKHISKQGNSKNEVQAEIIEEIKEEIIEEKEEIVE